MNDVMISIITPCFNSEKTIERTLQSVLNQTYQNYEYIIIDGESTDNTLDIIEQYKEKFNNKLKVVSERDDGIYDAMNKGISLSKGKLIGIVNSDDYYENDTLENIISAYNGEKYVVLYGFLRTFVAEKMNSIVFFDHHFLGEKMINHPTCFVSKELYNDMGVYSLEYKSSSDYDFMLRISQNKDVTFKPVYKILSNFELGGMSGSVLGMHETYKIMKKYKTISNEKYYFKRFYCFLLDIAKFIKKLRDK